jgi:hypothetical protein
MQSGIKGRDVGGQGCEQVKSKNKVAKLSPAHRIDFAPPQSDLTPPSPPANTPSGSYLYIVCASSLLIAESSLRSLLCEGTSNPI